MRGRARRSRALGIAALAIVALVASACGSPKEDTGGRLRVVAGFYPLAEAAQRVGGDLVSVENLTPPGVEPHDLELAPDDLERLLEADVVLIVGGGFQPAVEDALGDARGTVVDVLTLVDVLAPPAGEPAGQRGPAGTVAAADPHVWLDPERYALIVEGIAGVLAGEAPEGAEAFRANAGRYARELRALDAELARGLASCRTRLMVVNHAAFGYLADAYGLDQEPISGISPEAEPDPARLAELEALVEREGVTTILTEELVPPDVAEALAREAGVGTAVLNPLEGLTTDQLEAGEDYVSIMRRNLEVLRRALGCAA